MKNKHRFLSYLILMMLSNGIFAQVESPKDYLARKTYTLTTETQYQFDDFQSLTDAEKVTKSRNRTLDRVEKYLLPENEKYTIVKHEDTGNNIPEWTTEIKTTVVDMNGTTLYDKDERVFLSQKHSPIFKFANLSRTFDFGQPFPREITDRDISAFREQGIDVIQNSNTSFTIKTDFEETTVYTDLKIVVKKSIDKETGEFNKELTTFYSTLDNGLDLPRKIITREQFTTLRGDCAQKITTRTYSDYKIEDYRIGERLARDIRENKTNVVVSPNPASNLVYVNVPKLENEYKISISLYTIDGQFIKEIKSQGKASVPVPLDELDSGTYLINTQSYFFNETNKIVKL